MVKNKEILDEKTKIKTLVIPYKLPENWIYYDLNELVNELLEAKVAIRSLQNIPYQRNWVEELQKLELKREVAGTSRIEGADLTEYELDAAISGNPGELKTRSQKQVRAALETYKWIAKLKDDQPIDEELLLGIHRRIITGCADQHCPPGKLRVKDENVTFGHPRHRGVDGGVESKTVFQRFVEEMNTSFKNHDPIVQALAAHYHLAAMYPFLDGNGRSARALEALLLQRIGLKDTCFVAMSNYYYDEKTLYLQTLSEARAQNYNLTPFLSFALKGVALQSQRLMDQIKRQTQKLLFRDTVTYFSERLVSPRRRAITKRQSEILQVMLSAETMDWVELTRRVWHNYRDLKHPRIAIVRDVNDLVKLGALWFEEKDEDSIKTFVFNVNLDWPTKITETTFYKNFKEFPKAKSSFPPTR